MESSSLDLGEVKHQIAINHLKQLAQQRVSAAPPGDSPDNSMGNCSLGLEILKLWSKNQESHIKAAVQNQAFGGKHPINWEITFLAFMESCGTYLRDWGALVKAVDTYRRATEGGVQDEVGIAAALEHYHRSERQIQKLAECWGMGFQYVCDFVKYSPHGHPYWDGPYCGAFYSKDPEKPFIGLAFKGTNPLNLKEDLVDVNYQPITPDPGVLFDAEVSTGVYTGMFSAFKHRSKKPFEMIVGSLELLAASLSKESGGHDVPTHVTGHSLGGTYASLCFAQLLVLSSRIPKLPKPTLVGDLYTFGSPRLGLAKWAQRFYEAVGEQAGSSWRIVNDKDIIPDGPPTELQKTPPYFFHLDNGYRISKNAAPLELATERGMTPPPPPIPFPRDFHDIMELLNKTGDHFPQEYYKAMRRAMGEKE